MKINVSSEIGRLKKVLLHRPGKEVERLYPAIFKRILFDDALYLKNALKEHDLFAKKLKEEGVEVYYIEKLLADVFDASNQLRESFISQFIEQAGVRSKSIIEECKRYFGAIKNNYELVNATIAGIRKTDITPKFKNNLIDQVISRNNKYPFYIDPIPNILFQRDPITSIYDSVKINKMWSETRKRESIYIKYVLKYHPLLKNNNVWDNSADLFGSLEGGDVLIANRETILVGLSQRTDAYGIQNLVDNLFKRYLNLKRLIVIKIPNSHATMHLDTLFTQMDRGHFLVSFKLSRLSYSCFEITRNKTIAFDSQIIPLLKRYVCEKIKIVVVGGQEIVSRKNEQWNDGANCLCIRPGVVITYDRNKITNQKIRESGVKVIEIPSSELSRGRGGPRCMSMALERDDVTM